MSIENESNCILNYTWLKILQFGSSDVYVYIYYIYMYVFMVVIIAYKQKLYYNNICAIHIHV